jgi:integrase
LIERKNYQQVERFLVYSREVMQVAPVSIERYRAYLRHPLMWADYLPFSYAVEIQPTFVTYLTAARERTEASLAPATLKKILQITQRFFKWAKTTYPREFRTVPISWIDALRLPRIPQPNVDHEFVTLEEVLQLTNLAIDAPDLALQRDQAAAALLFLSGMRASALGSLTIECVDLANQTIKQWPALGVKTKNSKSATTHLLNIPELLQVVNQWDAFVRAQLPVTASWYTPIVSRWGEQKLSEDAPGKNRNTALEKRLRILFAKAQLPYRSPHKFRHGHAVFALQHAKTMPDYKAVSMNLMHSDIRVTDAIYAPLAQDEVKARIANLTGPTSGSQVADGQSTASTNHLTNDELLDTLKQRLNSGGR